MSGEKRRGSGSPTTEGSRWAFDVLDLSGGYTASSPTRRAFLLVYILLSLILLKASPFRRGGRVADGEVKKVTLSHEGQPNLFVDPENCLGNFRFRMNSLYYRSFIRKFDSLCSLRMTCSNGVPLYFLGFYGTPRMSSPTIKKDDTKL